MRVPIKKNNVTRHHPRFNNIPALLLPVAGAVLLYACTQSSGSTPPPPTAPALPVVTIQTAPAVTFRDFSASLEGKQDVEIRPQVDGYLEKIFVDEGAFVRKGQPLFKINDRAYREQLNNAKAVLLSARAGLRSADINVTRLQPLVANQVVSDVQLNTADASRSGAAAGVAQAEALVQAAEVNLGYTLITAPADGYVGRIPFKTGSRVGLNTIDPLTTVSAVKELYAYFSMSEKDFLAFEKSFPGNSVEEKLKHLPEAELVLADNSVYPFKGKIETVTGQFQAGMGSISFRAVFPNAEGLLRSGSTGRVRIPQNSSHFLAVPQESTFELQDKVFAFAVRDSNKVLGVPLSINAKSGNYYLVDSGLHAGDRIVYSGIDRLRDGAVIQPQNISFDSLLRNNPLNTPLR